MEPRNGSSHGGLIKNLRFAAYHRSSLCEIQHKKNFDFYTWLTVPFALGNLL